MSEQLPEISVVIGAKNARGTIGACLGVILRQSVGLKAQILVVDGSSDGTADLVAQQFPAVTLIRASSSLLMPELWGLGIQSARAPIIAITIGQCFPAEDWIAGILKVASERAESAGFGGPIDGPGNSTIRDWALYFSRYSAYMPPIQESPATDLAGDNAAYRRSALETCQAEWSRGFWENLIHQRLRRQGWTLTLSPEIRVQLGPMTSASQFCRERFRHGRHYGSTRPDSSPLTRLLRVFTAPALTPFLIFRIGSRVAGHRRDWLTKYLISLPWLFLFMSCWSLGEASGYVWPQRIRYARPPMPATP